RSIVRALIAETFRSTLVVAPDENAHPARRERQQARHLVDAVAAREQPQRMEMALGDRFRCCLVAMLQLRAGKVRFDGRHDRAPLWRTMTPPSNCFESFCE